MRRIQCSIDPPPPFFSTLLQYRKFELEWFPISIEDDVRQYSFVFQFPADCNAVRKRRPVRLIEFHAVPSKFLFAENLAQTHAVAFMFHVAHHTALNQQPHKPEEVGMFGQQIPVEPARIIILAVGIIIATLTTPHLVAHNKHGHTCRQYDCCEKVLHLPVAESLDFGIVRRTFEAAVPA